MIPVNQGRAGSDAEKECAGRDSTLTCMSCDHTAKINGHAAAKKSSFQDRGDSADGNQPTSQRSCILTRLRWWWSRNHPELADDKHSSSCPVEKVKAFEMRRDQLSTFLEIFRNDIFASIDISDDEDFISAWKLSVQLSWNVTLVFRLSYCVISFEQLSLWSCQ